MTLPDIIAIAVGLALDATAVAIATSILLGGVTARQVFRFSFHFGLFQALMPVAGWLAGSGFRPLIAAWDHWVAFGLLALIGGRAIVGAGGGPRPDYRPSTRDAFGCHEH
jgi:putative Mn2+ efflux pump MntP